MFAIVGLAWTLYFAYLAKRYANEISIFLLLEPAAPVEPSLFGFSEYLAAFALLLVILAVSDFKYQFRLRVTAIDVRTIAFVASFAIGFAISLIDLWFHNRWPVPAPLNDPNNLKVGLALLFLTLICILNYIAFLSPPRFGRFNARRAFKAIHYFVARGNADQLVVVSDWVGESAGRIMNLAADRRPDSASLGGTAAFGCNDYAAYTLSLLGNRKLCREMVDKSPWSVAALFAAAAKHPWARLPISEFARNVGSELVSNPHSPLYAEDDGYSAGLLGYTKPITKTVYGDFNLIEGLASSGGGPFEIELDLSFKLSASQLEAYTRAVLIFSESYFAQTYPHHSYAFVNALHKIEFCSHRLHRLNEVGDGYSDTNEFKCLKVTVDFTRELIDLLGKHPVPPKRKVTEHSHNDGLRAVYLQVAKFIFEFVKGASSVNRPAWTVWEVQHNALFADLFSYDDSPANKLLRFHLRRLIYDEIRRMDQYVNFVSARIIGYCWNVLGISEDAASRRLARDFDPIRRAAVSWARDNYLPLVRDYPAVAEACLMGGITFDRGNKSLVKTYSSMLGQDPKRRLLRLADQSAAASPPD